MKTSSRRTSDFTLQSSGSSGTRAANRVHLDSTKFLFSSKYFSQAKVPEKYGSQEIQSKETKSKEKRHPACERHNQANHLLAPYVEARPEGGARAEKEIGEKAQKIIRYQIVSTYFLHGAFKVLSFVPSLNTLKTFAHYMLCGYKKESGRTFGVFRTLGSPK